MIKNPKDKGRRWEHEAAELLEGLLGGKWKRVPGSGALGTQLKEPGLTGDIVGNLEYFPHDFRLEAKAGYGGATQFTVKKEWIDKIIDEAKQTNSIPAVVLKFTNARSGVRSAILFDFDTFAKLMKVMEGMYDELVRFYEKEGG